MSSPPIVFRRIAKLEMDESIAWYENQRENLGVEFALEIDRTLQRISLNPAQFPPLRGEVRRALLRRFPYGIHYLNETNRVVVLAVFHVKRNPQRLEGR
jgi:plasmid stabilization system protein ParE